MCDYSLMAIPNRLAVSREDLVVHRFEAAAVGLASVSDIKTRQACRNVQSHGFWSSLKRLFNAKDSEAIPAVCIPPGARLLIRDIPAKLQQECGLQEIAAEAVFTQITAAVNAFRDAVRFQNGTEVLLQRFAEGQRVRVLDLSSSDETEPAFDERQRVMV